MPPIECYLWVLPAFYSPWLNFLYLTAQLTPPLDWTPYISVYISQLNASSWLFLHLTAHSPRHDWTSYFSVSLSSTRFVNYEPPNEVNISRQTMNFVAECYVIVVQFSHSTTARYLPRSESVVIDNWCLHCMQDKLCLFTQLTGEHGGLDRCMKMLPIWLFCNNIRLLWNFK